jgi:site-specific DNA recombinase
LVDWVDESIPAQRLDLYPRVMALRALIEIRLSNETEESTSPERQREQDEAYCGIKGWDIVHVCRDLDVSGAISPFDRGDLGKWLTAPELIDQWDVLVVSRLDRLSRSVLGYADLLRWCEDNGKAIAVVTENFDLTTAVGRATAMIIIVFAQLMREQTAENRRAAQAALRAQMLYGGGPIFYGYEKYKDGAHWPLRPCPAEAANIVYWADQVIDHGRSCDSLTVEMNRKGILTKRGHRWPKGRILEILRSPVLRGIVLYYPPKLPSQKIRPKPQFVLGDDGMPVRREPVLSDERWYALQAAPDRNSRDRGSVKSKASPLLGVVRCFLCGSRLTFNHYGGKYAYYRCPKISERQAGYGNVCPAKAIPAEWLQTKTGEIFLAEAGHVPIKTKIATPDTSQAERIAAIGRQIAELTTERFVLGVERDDFEKHIDSLKRLHAELSAEPVKEPVVRWQDTGRTVADEWAARDTNGRRLLMIAAGFSIDVAKLRSGTVLAHMFDTDLERRAGLAAMGAREVPVVPNELTGARSVLTFDQRGNECLDGGVLVQLGVVEDQD